MDHPAPSSELARPWRTATLVATTVAGLELVLLVVAGIILLGKSLAPHVQAAAQRQARSNGSQQAPQAPRGAPGSQSSASAPGSEPGDAGPGDPEASGPGDGEGADPVGAASLTPGAQSVGEFQPAGQARRLDVQGRPVEVDVQPGQQPGQRAGDQDPRNERPSDQLGAISAISGEAPGRVSAAVPAESNFVPNERRQVVRDYFSSGEGR